MKIFAIYGQIQLVKPPKWFADFRARYDKPYPLHLTFKQPCWVPDDEIPAVKDTVGQTVQRLDVPGDTLHVRFDELMLHPPEAVDDGYVMLRAVDTPLLHTLQQAFVEAVSQYRQYTKPELAGYEAHFEPHITIGRKLSPQEYQEAVASIPAEHTVEAVIESIVLAIVPEDTPDHAKDPVNRIVFPL